MRIAGSQIDVLIFDLFGVLIGFEDGLVTERLARRCADPTEARERLHKFTAWRDVITGVVTLPQLHRELVDSHGLTMSHAEFEAAWLEPYSWPIPGMAGLVARLSEHYRLVLLSNVDRDYWRVVRAMHPELDCFELLLVSCDLGMAKPDAAIYRHVSRLTGVEPSGCFFVDDTAANVEAARALGFHGHVFSSVERLTDELRSANAGGV